MGNVTEAKIDKNSKIGFGQKLKWIKTEKWEMGQKLK